MSDIAIQVHNLHKKYELGSISSGTLSRDLNKWWAKVRGKEDTSLRLDQNSNNGDYWALKGVDFDVKQGDSIGIIGKNGAGKSTLLKILSRVTAPTKGSIQVKGRIASLLEVGTGFHPDLTGRENIYMNGAILGMSRREINRQLDNIIDFSGVSQHIDTPVKRYSSGMYVRLAFAVAAHLESEILIIDEVLAVGDSEFQNKCLGKMGEIGQNGRTILFVSHQLNMVLNLCNRSIMLDKGTLVKNGNTPEVVDYYVSSRSSEEYDFEQNSNKNVYPITATILDVLSRKAKEYFFIGEDVLIEFTLKVNQPVKNLIISMNITNAYEELYAHVTNLDDGSSFESVISDGKIVVRATLKEVGFLPQKYYVSIWGGSTLGTDYFYAERCTTFSILQNNDFIKRPYEYPRHAKVVAKSSWQIMYGSDKSLVN